MAGLEHKSLLYTFVSGEEVIEGPLDPSAYAQTDMPGIGGARLAAVDGSAGVDIITFEDAEVGFSATLGGNAVVAPLSPEVPEPGSEEQPVRSLRAQETKVYTVEEGDTLAGIAAKFDISTNTVLWANGLRERDVLKVGDHVTILPTTGVLHTVKSGDTLLAIADEYDVQALEVATYNGLSDTHKLSIGQKLIVPDGYIEARQAPQVVPRDTRIAEREPDGPTPEPVKVTAGSRMLRPVAGYVSQTFGRWGHTGVDIAGNAGAPVYAAGDGTVEFSGWMGGYGNLIIVNHGSGTETYYAHNSALYVKKGQSVAKGAAIGKVGSTGRSTGPHLHLELRKNGRPVNPCGVVSC